MSYKTAVFGASGFAGIELVRILSDHPDFDLKCVVSDSYKGMPVSELYPAFIGKTDLMYQTADSVDMSDLDVAFLAVPHTGALALAPKLIENGCTVIDLSADFRLKDPEVYELHYQTAHTARELLADAAFGLPELFPEDLERVKVSHANGDAVLVACAGCYPTATSLASAPAIRAGLMKQGSIVVADAISGVTGAGKKPSARTHFCSANESVEAYGVHTHRHTPEIEQILGLSSNLVFTPHLAPLNRGLLSTVTIQLADDVASIGDQPLNSAALVEMYREFYKGSPFVKVLSAGEQPKSSSVAGSNNAQIGLSISDTNRTLVATCAIDNLCKGAAGQAIQCANIVFGLDQSAGLPSMALPV